MDKDASALFQLVVATVGYQDFTAWPLETYHKLARLGMMDLWSGLGEDRKLQVLKMTWEQLKEAREHELYPKLLDALRTAMERVTRPTETSEELIKAASLSGMRSLLLASRYSTREREQLKAAREFTDRTDPKIRKEEHRHLVQLDEKSAAHIAAALAAVGRAGYLGAPGEPQKLLVAADVVRTEADTVDGEVVQS